MTAADRRVPVRHAPFVTKRRRRSHRCEWAYAPCSDCDTDTTPADGPSEWYMVHAELWAQAGMGAGWGECLCIGCLERRLGRMLTSADFTDARVNRVGYGQDEHYAYTERTPRLLLRLIRPDSTQPPTDPL